MRNGGAAHKNQKRRGVLVALRAVVIPSEAEESFSFAIKQVVRKSTLNGKPVIPQTCGHRPIYIRGEAATFIPNS